jgi:hypothetical protein
MPDKHQTTRVVLHFLQKHPGQIYHYMDIGNEVHIAPNAVGAALSRMAKVHPEYGVTRTGSGHYLFRLSDQKKAELVPVDPTEVGVGDLFEVIGSTKKGTILLRGEKSGLIYTLGDEL